MKQSKLNFNMLIFLQMLELSEKNGLVYIQRQLLSHLNISDFHDLYDGMGKHNTEFFMQKKGSPCS
jgi:hypothetical protein